MIFLKTDYQEDEKRRWAFCQRQRGPGEKGQEEVAVSTSILVVIGRVEEVAGLASTKTEINIYNFSL